MRTLVPVIAASLLVLAGGAAWWYVNQVPQEGNKTATTTVQALPRDSGAMLSFTTKDGKVVSVPDFTYGHPSVDVEDTAYTFAYVTQSLEGVEEDPRYGIVYGNDGSLVVGLYAEPWSTTRLAAEAKLRTLMPLPDPILCALPIEVTVPDTIENIYTGKQLGLSFCPNALDLP